MSSFHKTSDSRVTISGTKVKNSLPIVSSGIPSLDHVIGIFIDLFTLKTNKRRISMFSIKENNDT